MDFVAGIDIGAKSTKVVILDANQELRGKIAIKTRPDFTAVAKEALDLALQKAGLKEKELSYIATTGFGRYNVPFRDVQITEITCVARGAAAGGEVPGSEGRGGRGALDQSGQARDHQQRVRGAGGIRDHQSCLLRRDRGKYHSGGSHLAGIQSPGLDQKGRSGGRGHVCRRSGAAKRDGQGP
ncbi:MAG: hypothetical protein HYS67_06790 [Deltaproteobacteria bacterium]|nr:hypothetical protein [Deltaproteobacteria bacterium]